MFTLQFWQAAVERAVKSLAQALVALLGTSGLGLLDVNWRTAISVAGMTGVLSVLTSLASLPVGSRGDPSLLGPKADDQSGLLVSGSLAPSVVGSPVSSPS